MLHSPRSRSTSLVIIPCYNAGQKLGPLIQATRDYFSHILVIDDGSSDDSGRIAKRAGAELIAFQRNRGVGAALKCGFEVAQRRGVGLVATLDADGAHDPRDLPPLIRAHQRMSATMTVGTRWSARCLDHLPSGKRWANAFASRLVERITGKLLSDVTCGLRIIDPKVLAFESHEDRFGFLYEHLFHAIEVGHVCNHSVTVRYDASMVWLTKRDEFLAMLNACFRQASGRPLKDKIQAIRTKLRRWASFALRLQARGAQELVFAHAFSAQGGYIFQHQHPSFDSVTDTRAIDF